MLQAIRLTDRIYALVICLIFIFFSSFYVIGHYQNHNGDFGQYFIHAMNILKGRPWSFMMEGKPTVMPLYPGLLAALTAVFGPNAFWYAFLNSVLWAGVAFISYIYFRPNFRSEFTAYVFLASVLFCPYVLSFQQDGQPNITYTFLFILAMYAVRDWDRRNPRALEVIAVFLPAVTRVDSFAIYVALIVFLAWNRRWHLLAIPITSAAVTVGLNSWLAVCCNTRSSFNIFLVVGERHASGGDLNISNYFFGLLKMIVGFTLRITDIVFFRVPDGGRPFQFEYVNGFSLPFGYLHGAILVLLFVGVLVRGKLITIDHLIFGAHIGLISSLIMPGLPMRYMLPVIPIALFFIVSGLEKSMPERWVRPSIAGGAIGLIAVPMLVLGVQANMHIPRQGNTLFTENVDEMADWLAINKGERPIGYTKDRLITVLLDIRGAANEPTYGLRTVRQAENLLERDGLLVIRKAFQAPLLDYVAQRPDVRRVFDNEDFSIYASDG
jgi:hypothetical protein